MDGWVKGNMGGCETGRMEGLNLMMEYNGEPGGSEGSLKLKVEPINKSLHV